MGQTVVKSVPFASLDHSAKSLARRRSPQSLLRVYCQHRFSSLRVFVSASDSGQQEEQIVAKSSIRPEYSFVMLWPVYVASGTPVYLIVFLS